MASEGNHTFSEKRTREVLLGRTITFTQARTTSIGVTAETVASQTATSRVSDGSISVANGLTQDTAVTRNTDITAYILFSHVESTTVSGLTFSIS
jgi:hypothetical protein